MRWQKKYAGPRPGHFGLYPPVIGGTPLRCIHPAEAGFKRAEFDLVMLIFRPVRGLVTPDRVSFLGTRAAWHPRPAHAGEKNRVVASAFRVLFPLPLGAAFAP